MFVSNKIQQAVELISFPISKTFLCAEISWRKIISSKSRVSFVIKNYFCVKISSKVSFLCVKISSKSVFACCSAGRTDFSNILTARPLPLFGLTKITSFLERSTKFSDEISILV